MSEHMLVIKTDGTLERIPITKTSRTLDLLQDAVEGMVDVVALGESLDLWVNDEGLISNMIPNFPATWLLYGLRPDHRDEGTLLFGPCVLAAHNDEGDLLACPDGVIDNIYGTWRQPNDR